MKLDKNQLFDDNGVVLHGLAEGASLSASKAGPGIFLHFTLEKSASRHEIPLGDLQDVKRFTCAHRYEPFWMNPAAGTRGGQTPSETQYLLAERKSGGYLLLIPLIDDGQRCSLQGAGDDGLVLVSESGDRAVTTAEVTGLYVATGDKPYTLLADAAKQVADKLKDGSLRRDKAVPEMSNWFGWCTWDAFYHDVSHEKVKEGLESFKAGGVQPKMLILDDGWQDVETRPTGEKQLSGFDANQQFPDGLAATVRLAKEDYGVNQFLVWHAFNGYWSGVNDEKLPGYDVVQSTRQFSAAILSYCPTLDDSWWGAVVGVVPGDRIYQFFNDYHSHLRRAGVDGIKTDNQGMLEGVSHGFGGRVRLMRQYRQALEGSAHVHFKGNLINCMSLANEMVYTTLNSTITRTSTDFWPNKPESHGLHLYTNAQVSVWFGEFIQPDWDMFQSSHAMGPFHAAGRAVGGCPVYVSDKPDGHNFDLLKKLVLPDGRVLRCEGPGRPTVDCLFADVTKEQVLLKIFNTNTSSGVVGVFNARYPAEGEKLPPIRGQVSPADVEGLDGDRFLAFAHSTGKTTLISRDERIPVELEPLGFDVYTFVPIVDGLAPLGYRSMFNSGGAVIGYKRLGKSALLTLLGGGSFSLWAEKKPGMILVAGQETGFSWDAQSRLISLEIPAGEQTLEVIF